MARGSLRVGALAGVEVHLHWTLPVGLLLFNGFRWDPVGWACFIGLVLAHELGHALVARAVGAVPLRVEVSGFGGLCFWRGEVTPLGRACIAWGGVWAQLLVLAAALGWELLAGAPADALSWRVLGSLLSTNASLVVLNLVPIRPLDGAEAWRLPLLLGRALRRRVAGGKPPAGGPSADAAAELDAEFDAGARRDEVKALVSELLDDAKKEPEP